MGSHYLSCDFTWLTKLALEKQTSQLSLVMFGLLQQESKSEHNVIMLQKLHYLVLKLQCILHRNTNATTQSYIPQILHKITLNYKQNYVCSEHTQTMQLSCTQNQHIHVAMYNVHMKLSWCVYQKCPFLLSCLGDLYNGLLLFYHHVNSSMNIAKCHAKCVKGRY